MVQSRREKKRHTQVVMGRHEARKKFLVLEDLIYNECFWVTVVY